MEANLKNSFNNILLSTGNVIEYLAGLKSKNLIVPNNRLDQNNNSKYNGLISTLNLSINQYNAVLDEFVVELNGTELLIDKLKATWAVEDSNQSTVTQTTSSDQRLNNLTQPQNGLQTQKQQDLPSSEGQPGVDFGDDVKMDIDDDAYLNQFLEGDVDDGMETNGLLDFGNSQLTSNLLTTSQPATSTSVPSGAQNFDSMVNIDGIDGDKNPADILYQGSAKPSLLPPNPNSNPLTNNDTNQNSSSNNPEKIDKEVNNDDINLDDLEELLASTNDPNDITYDSNGVPIDDNNIFDELNYFLGGEEGG